MKQVSAAPTVMTPSSELPPQTKRILSVREREDLQQTVNVWGYGDAARPDNFIPGAQGAAPVSVPWVNVNRPRLNAQQKDTMRILREHSPEPIPVDQKDRYARRAKELEAQFTDPEFFQSREEVRVIKRDNPAYFRALEKAQKWSQPQPKLGGRSPEDIANEWRNIMRRLEPESDLHDSFDRLRKDH